MMAERMLLKNGLPVACQEITEDGHPVGPLNDSYSHERFAARYILQQILKGRMDELELAKFLKLFKASPDG